jgi:hypothetical protein
MYTIPVISGIESGGSPAAPSNGTTFNVGHRIRGRQVRTINRFISIENRAVDFGGAYPFV